MIKIQREARRAARSAIPEGGVIIERPFVPERFDLLDISTSGALIEGTGGLALNQRLRIILLLDGIEPPGPAVGRVVAHRTSQFRNAYALHFGQMSSRFRCTIANAVLFQLRQNIARTALVVEKSRYIRRHIQQTLGGLGAEVAVATSALDCLMQLTHSKVDTVYVGNPLGTTSGRELAGFLTSQRLCQRVVMLVDPQDQIDAQTQDESDEMPVSDTLALEILEKPWLPSRLACFLLPQTRSSAHA